MRDEAASAVAAAKAEASSEPAPPKPRRVRKKPSRKSEATIAAAEARLGHAFADGSLLATALTHVSALKASEKRSQSYQRLEFLGDRVLGLAISEMLFRDFPNADEGEMSKRLSDLVRKETCADVARKLGLNEDVRLGQMGGTAAAQLRETTLGDLCEAVIGAIHLDGGYAAAKAFVERNWAERMRKPSRALRDPKTRLQEWAQGRGLAAPLYREIERTGPDHDPRFRVAVEVADIAAAEGVGPNKRAAEKAAAVAMLARENVADG